METQNEPWILLLNELKLPYNTMTMPNIVDPRTWFVIDGMGAQKMLADRAKSFFYQIERDHPQQEIWVSVQQDEAGQHKFINLKSAKQFFSEECKETELELTDEELVKDSGSLLLYARPESEEQIIQAKFFGEKPRARHTIVEQLSLGNNFMILTNQLTLCHQFPEEPCFDNLALIVNCHEDKCDTSKYKVGSCSSETPPKVICHAVHNWWKGQADLDEISVKCDEIQREIWEALQRGSVAIHCMAGLHRAPAILAAQYLYRHYTLGHTQITTDMDYIYKYLESIRPAVSACYTDVLVRYEKFLKNQ